MFKFLLFSVVFKHLVSFIIQIMNVYECNGTNIFMR